MVRDLEQKCGFPHHPSSCTSCRPAPSPNRQRTCRCSYPGCSHIPANTRQAPRNTRPRLEDITLGAFISMQTIVDCTRASKHQITVKSRVKDPFTYKTTPLFQPQNQYEAIFLHFQKICLCTQILGFSESKSGKFCFKMMFSKYFFLSQGFFISNFSLKVINVPFSGNYFLFCPNLNSILMIS